MKKNSSALVISIVVLSIVLPSVNSIIVQNQTEDQKTDPKEKEKIGDKTPPIISIENLPGGDGTDNNPGQWDVFAYDAESGIDEDSIEVYIDGVLIGQSFGNYDVPASLGDHIILVEVMNDNAKNPLLASSSNSVSIIDDDLAPPELSDLIIDCNMECVIISLTAMDYSGIGDFKVLINEEVITPINIEENDNHFIFILENQWIFESGIYNVEIQAKDADNDRENDALSSSICGMFEISLDAIYQFVIWKIEEIKNYIDSNIESRFKRCLIRKLSFIQDNLNEALSCFEEGEITRSLFYDLTAKFILWIVEIKLERTEKISDEQVNFIMDELRTIRNCIVNLMGASLGTELSSEITNVEINLLNLLDYIKDNMEGRSGWCLRIMIRSATFKLDRAIIFLSQGKNPTHLLNRAQCRLRRAISHVECLLKKGRISQDIADNIKDKLLQFVEDIEILFSTC
ncbi:MAG: hypothetical protein ACXAC5_14995 [Promethearchaeota archaeon]